MDCQIWGTLFRAQRAGDAIGPALEINVARAHGVIRVVYTQGSGPGQYDYYRVDDKYLGPLACAFA
eukprot:1242283-Alexandrium_andersonii.AAC.1